MRTVVFLGPSLQAATARQVLADALFLPPCAMGDVLGAMQCHRPQVIAIIDGLFERTPAVWHKEILYALSQGIAVFGGGSMGALRAAELHAYGMRGVGHSYEGFASGRLDDDDEVAITHLAAEDGYRPLSEPMVNLRYGLALALQAGLIDAAEEQSLIAAMKQLFYPDRCWEALYAQALAQGMAVQRVHALQELVAARRPDRKAEDGLAVLQVVRDWRLHKPAAPAATPAATPGFEPTVFWEHLVACYGQVGGVAPGLRQNQLIDHVRLGIPGRQQLLGEALCGVLLRLVRRVLGELKVDDQAALVRFRRERGLEKPAALRLWMQTQGVDEEQCLELARDEARVRQAQWRFQEEISREIPRVLQRQGRYAAVAGDVQAQWQHLADLGIAEPQARDVKSLDAVLQWYDRTWGPVHGEMAAHVVERGFGSPRQFMTEMLARYLVACAEASSPASNAAGAELIECES
jgi:hypothetical protein